VVRALLEAGAQVLLNRFGTSAVHAAAFSRQVELLELLCERVTCVDDPDLLGATPAALLKDTEVHSELAAGRLAAAPSLGDIEPTLSADWHAAADDLVSVPERRLLVHLEAPASVSPSALITDLALAKQSLTFDRRVRTALEAGPEAVLSVPGILDEKASTALRAQVDAHASLRRGNTDQMPEFTLHLDAERLHALLGSAAAPLLTLPGRFTQQGGSSRELLLRECFVRKFSAETRPWIKMHADVAAVTINVALSSEVDASGGRLLGVFNGAVRAIERRAGDATVHSSSLLHGVSRMTTGERYTLILFFE
jgi:predicted 2-oxoglutarate/Fe(II)-dependent dioxygenase YbiX